MQALMPNAVQMLQEGGDSLVDARLLGLARRRRGMRPLRLHSSGRAACWSHCSPRRACQGQRVSEGGQLTGSAVACPR